MRLYRLLSPAGLDGPMARTLPRGSRGDAVMVESIFVRVQRVLSAGTGSTLDAVERVSSASMMREAIREADRAADDACSAYEAALSRGLQAQRQQQIIKDRLATLDDQARFALSKERPDLAEAAITRQIEFEAEARRLKQVEKDAREEALRLEQCREALKLRRAQMYKELTAFEAAQRVASFDDIPTPAERAERKAARAAAVFERAMAAAGVPGAGPMDAKAAAKLAEVDALQREAAVADRLAALKAAQGVAAPAKKPAGGAKAKSA